MHRSLANNGCVTCFANLEEPSLRHRHNTRTTVVPPGARFLGFVFGCLFGGVGLTVLAFLWTAQGFGAPPLFFRLFGSFIALAFVAFGGTMIYGSLHGSPAVDLSASSTPPSQPANKGSYTCPHCSGGLETGADVSPHGDVKCSYCDRWFNIHGR